MDSRPRGKPVSKNIFDNVPPAYQERFIEIVALADDFCDRFLNDDYKQVCRKMAVGICQKGSPVLRGKPASWACGIMYAVGRINFLTDPSQVPHMKAEEIAQGFGVSPTSQTASTGSFSVSHWSYLTPPNCQRCWPSANGCCVPVDGLSWWLFRERASMASCWNSMNVPTSISRI